MGGTGKSWQAKSVFNELHFEGEGASLNNYLNRKLYSGYSMAGIRTGGRTFPGLDCKR